MMSPNRKDYASASEWLEALKQDYLWQRQLQKLQISDDISNCRKDAEQMIGNGETCHLWKILNPDVEKVVEEVWILSELTLPKLRLQTIGMLSIVWLEQHVSTNNQYSEIIRKLKPMFYGDEDEAKAFLTSIQGMKSTQITNKVNQLARENKISELSRKRDLWKVLHNCGIYEKTETNWNNQVK